MKADAPDEPEPKRVVVSGANGEVDVYSEVSDDILFRPQRSDKYFFWGDAPPKSADSARSVRGYKPSKGGGLPPTKEEAEKLVEASKAKLAEPEPPAPAPSAAPPPAAAEPLGDPIPATAGGLFIASSAFAGAKPGYVFKKDQDGTGYYLDQVGAAEEEEDDGPALEVN